MTRPKQQQGEEPVESPNLLDSRLLRAELIGHHSSLQLKPGTVVNVDPSSLVQRLEKELKQMSDLRMGRIGEDVILAFNEAEPSIGTGTYTPKEGEVAREYQGQAFEFMLKLPRDYPYSPPACQFTTPVFHPQVRQDGTLRAEPYGPQGETWHVQTQLATMVRDTIAALFVDSELSPLESRAIDPLNEEAAWLLLADRAAYGRKVRDVASTNEHLKVVITTPPSFPWRGLPEPDPDAPWFWNKMTRAEKKKKLAEVDRRILTRLGLVDDSSPPKQKEPAERKTVGKDDREKQGSSSSGHNARKKRTARSSGSDFRESDGADDSSSEATQPKPSKLNPSSSSG